MGPSATLGCTQLPRAAPRALEHVRFSTGRPLELPSERASERVGTRIEVGHDPFAAHAALAVYAPSWLSFARIPRRVSPVVDAQPLTGLSGSTYRE